MHYEHSTTIPTSRKRVWAFLIDVPRVSQCVPGVRDVAHVSGTKYTGTLELDLGMISLALGGDFELDHPDESSGQLTMHAQANDKKIPGHVSATLAMQLQELAPEQVQLTISTDIDMLGRLGDFGRPFVKKRADQMMAEFTENLRASLTSASA